MNIEVLYFDGCPNHRPTLERVTQAVSRLGVIADVREVKLGQDDDPVAMKFIGSPTVLIDGQDIDPAQRAEASYGFGCRTFGGANMPDVDMIETAIIEAAGAYATPGISARSPRGLNSLLVLPAVGATLLPVGVCPACWPVYAGVLSASGLGFLLKTDYLLPVAVLFLLVAVGALAFRAKSRRGYAPCALGLAAAAAVLVGKFLLVSDAMIGSGMVLLVAASIWNAWPRKTTGVNGGSCSA